MLWTFGVVALLALYEVYRDIRDRKMRKRIDNLEWLITVPVKKLAEAYREQEAEVEQQMRRTYGLQPHGLAPTSRPVVMSRPLAQNGHQPMSEDAEWRAW